MGLKRYRFEGDPKSSPSIARAVEAAGWLYVSGQVPIKDGELVSGNITAQARQAIVNVLSILEEAGYGPEHVVRCGIWLDDPRDFSTFNSVFREYFGDHPPARACIASGMVIDCKVEIDCVAYKEHAVAEKG